MGIGAKTRPGSGSARVALEGLRLTLKERISGGLTIENANISLPETLPCSDILYKGQQMPTFILRKHVDQLFKLVLG